jgi:TM2 domain-containing membrane protein YozV
MKKTLLFLFVTIFSFSMMKADFPGSGTEKSHKSEKNIASPGQEGSMVASSIIESTEAESASNAELDFVSNPNSRTLSTTPAPIYDRETFQKIMTDAGVKPFTAKIVAKKIEKRLEKAKKANKTQGGDNQIVALILCFFLGGLGIHRFYLGYTGIGILMLLTGGLCGILTLIDFIRIIIGDLQPRNGSYTKTL